MTMIAITTTPANPVRKTRVRHHVNNGQVCHLWAHQSQDWAKGASISFDGKFIKSYGTDIGRIIDSLDGSANCVLIDVRDYSVTTSSHRSSIRYASRHFAQFDVCDLGSERKGPDHDRNFRYYAERVTEQIGKGKRAIKYKVHHYDNALDLAREANAYAAFFGLLWRIDGPVMDDVRNRRNVAHANEANRRAAEDARAAECRAREAERLEAIAPRWVAGENIPMHGYPRTLLRLRGEGDSLTVQTSRGAEFPAFHCRRAFALISACKAAGREWTPNGHSVHMGHFTIDFIDAFGNVRAGCHHVEWSEIERLAGLLGLTVATDPGLEIFKANLDIADDVAIAV